MKTEKEIKHIAIIMDGNGRWAKERGLPHLAGHREGALAAKRTIEAASKLGIKYVTLYTFSTENWKRSKEEVDGLMDLLLEFLDANLNTFIENKLRLVVIGRLWQLPEPVRQNIEKVVELTANHEAGTIVLALSYGGRAEIVDAVKKIGGEIKDGKIDPQKIDEEVFRRYLYAPDIPDPDLMIRTSGELRLSNFLLWQLSYSEFYVTDLYWPDFNEEHLKKALNSFGNRERRFGGRK